MSKTMTVNVTNVSVRGVTVDGDFPLFREEDDGRAVIRHPDLGLIRVPRENTDLPSLSGVTLDYEELIEDIRSRFKALDRLLAGVVGGTRRSLIISGAPGVGKTHKIQERLQQALEAGVIRTTYTHTGSITPINLYRMLHANREDGQVIYVDDSDSIFETEEGLNLLKHATDSGKTRTVAYSKDAPALEAENIPKQFEYRGAIIFSSNICFDREIAAKTKRAEHLGAFVNRAAYLDLGLHTTQALIARVEDVSLNTPMLRDEGLDDAQIQTVLRWLKDNISTLRSVSLRTAMQLGRTLLDEPDTWKETAKLTLLRQGKY